MAIATSNLTYSLWGDTKKCDGAIDPLLTWRVIDSSALFNYTISWKTLRHFKNKVLPWLDINIDVIRCLAISLF